MAFVHRKLLPAEPRSNPTEKGCSKFCDDENVIDRCPKSCVLECPSRCSNLSNSESDPVSDPSDQIEHHVHHFTISVALLIVFCMIGILIFFAVSWIIIFKCFPEESSSDSTQSDDTEEEDFLDSNRGPTLPHPIWFINTVGLQQSAIDAITICKYKAGDGLVEGTECSVCLAEFQEDESLRLLPKCSHAFHLPCIDTWLRSHKNCPLCRAPVIAEGDNLNPADSNSSVSGTAEETQMENYENHGSEQLGEGGTSEMRDDDRDLGALPTGDERFRPFSGVSNCELRVVVSDLTDENRSVEELQLVRRSFSFDSPSALAIHNAAASVLVHPSEQGGTAADSHMEEGKRMKKLIVGKKGFGNLSLCKMMKSYSLGRCLDMGPVSMKRSFSGGKVLGCIQNRRHSSSLFP